MTPDSFPYTLNISVYNEAGEAVAVLFVGDVKGGISGAEITIDGKEGPFVFEQGSVLEVFLPEIETSVDPGNKGAMFGWDGTNDQGQYVSQGVYYVQISRDDGFDHVDTLTETFTVINNMDYVEMNIYNSAGELVRSVREYKSVESADIALLAVQPNPQALSYGKSDDSYVEWDGKSARGTYVSNGVYEVQFIFETKQGMITATKKVVVMNMEEDTIGEVRIIPNPYRGQEEGIKIAWSGIGEGDVSIFIYNSAGELVKRTSAAVAQGSVVWDGKTVSGEKAVSGLYVCVVRSNDSAGFIERKRVKFAIAGWYQQVY